MNFTQQQVSAQCQAVGSQLVSLPSTIQGEQLLWALSGNESSFGINCGPRHEPAFDVGGQFYRTSAQQQKLVSQFGSAAACSYGPWQMMFCNAPAGSTPADFDDIAKCTSIALGFLNAQFKHFQPKSISDIGSIWNAGHVQNPFSPGVQAYANLLQIHYGVPLA
jgi:hypothetical protein